MIGRIAMVAYNVPVNKLLKFKIMILKWGHLNSVTNIFNLSPTYAVDVVTVMLVS